MVYIGVPPFWETTILGSPGILIHVQETAPRRAGLASRSQASWLRLHQGSGCQGQTQRAQVSVGSYHVPFLEVPGFELRNLQPQGCLQKGQGMSPQVEGFHMELRHKAPILWFWGGNIPSWHSVWTLWEKMPSQEERPEPGNLQKHHPLPW